MNFKRTKAVLASAKAKLSSTFDRCMSVMAIVISEATDLFGLAILLFIGSLLALEIVVTSITTVIAALFKFAGAVTLDIFKEQQ